MTDNEMAEEYVTKECCTTCKNINHFCKEKCECWSFARKGFLAGLNKALDIKDSSDKRLEPILYKLKDLGVIESWYKNDTYHACKGVLKMTDNELLDIIKQLIITLDDTTWDEGHPGYSDSEPGYKCPDCSCDECYRACCEYNKSALFKKLHEELPKLYENGVVNK